MMRRRHMIESSGGEAPTPTPQYGGLPVFMDNCYYPVSNGYADSVESDEDFFLVLVDFGSSASNRNLTVTRFGTPTRAALREFSNDSSYSVDYWTIMRTDMQPGAISTMTLETGVRYLIFSVYKQYAADFYLKYTNGDYIIKGNNVT